MHRIAYQYFKNNFSLLLVRWFPHSEPHDSNIYLRQVVVIFPSICEDHYTANRKLCSVMCLVPSLVMAPN